MREIQQILINECEKSTGEDSMPNLIDAFLVKMSKGSPSHIYNLDQLDFLLFDIFLAFTEAVITTFLWILLYLAQYDEVQTQIRQELFEVSRGEQVKMDDFAHLPYTKAAIAEATRIRSLTPTGLPHYATETICVEGFTIPKDAMIMPLLWAIHMDPDVYENPEEFCPERFLDDEGQFFKPDTFVPFHSGKIEEVVKKRGGLTFF